MSSVVLQVGQCGNQIGQHFWKKASRDESSEKCHVYRSHDGYLRTVNVDSESKVVKKVQKNFKIRESSIVCGKRGRGTNWALGYHGLSSKGDNHLLEDSLEGLRKEVERCEQFTGTVVCHSLSGGTGSGLGSRLCECIRDLYPLQYILSCAVAPYDSGESPLQHYNTSLTLAALQRYADGILLVHNDEVLRRVTSGPEQGSAGFDRVNTAIADSLCGVVLPTDTLSSRGFSLGQEPWEMIRSLCPMPDLKFLNIGHASKSKLSWEGLVSNITHSHRRRDEHGNAIHSISNLLIARGDSTGTFFRNLKATEEKLKSAYNVVTWNPFPNDFWSAKASLPGTKGQSSVTIATNTAGVMDYIDTVSYKARLMYGQKAYLHWYTRHGATGDDFTEAFEMLESIYGSYAEAVK